jgi:aminoglycoside phosphotransferase (APT) family kinase protein
MTESRAAPDARPARPNDPSVRVDAAGSVRSGEELDAQAVDRWLKALVPALQGAPAVTQYSGGASNWTYRLHYATPPAHDFVLRRPPAGTRAKSAHDMGREYRVQQALRPVYPWVPAMIGLCTDEAVIGADFYVMERLEGLIPRGRRGLGLSSGDNRAVCSNVLDKLVELHRVDYEAAGLASLGKGAGYCKRQVEGWSERYEKARTWNVPSYRYVRAWLAEHTPNDVATCVIHNDFRLDNVVLDAKEPTRVIGVLDWEMATLGDPLMDLGSALAYWVQANDDPLFRLAGRQPTHLPGMFTRREVVETYLDRTGYRPDDWTFYEVFGLFRLAVIAQQIYYRYHHGQTRNRAFKNFWIMVNYLDWRSRALIQLGRFR